MSDPGLTPNVGLRRRIGIEGENYYLVVTRGPDGYAVDVTCPRENAPDNRRVRGIVETLTEHINHMLTEVHNAGI